MSDRNSISRRKAMRGLGAGLIATAASRAFAANPTAAENSSLQVSGGDSQEKIQSFGSQTPLGRPGQPAELASIYVQLAANDASYATGQIYGSAGGSGQP